MRACASCGLLVLAACASRSSKDTIKIGVEEYDQYFMAVNALLHEVEQGISDAGVTDHEGVAARAQQLQTQAQRLLTEINEKIAPSARGRVRRALEEAMRRISQIRTSAAGGSRLEQPPP